MLLQTEKITPLHKTCTALILMLRALPFAVNAEEDETHGDRAFEYFDNYGDGVLNDSEKA